jgi:integrase
VEFYRAKRLSEITKRGGPPAPATLDREVELLKRLLNFAVDCGNLTHNPIARAKLLRKPNVRRMVLDEEGFLTLYAAAEPDLKPILLTDYDTGMRLQEVLRLRWSQIDLRDGIIRLAAEDTKTEQPRVIYLTTRVRDNLRILPRHLHTDYLFVNPKTGKPWWEVRKMFRRACKKAGIEGLWFHDLRRSFVTNARRRGVPESVVMKISGHKTRSIFDRYNIVSEDDLRDAARRIEAGAAQFSSQYGQYLDSQGDPASP